MKRFLFIPVLLVLLSLSGCKVQQDPATALAESEEMEFLYQEAVQALKEKDFVLEAHTIVFKYGNFTYVNPTTNFIKLSGDEATVQLAFNSPYAGANGLGGITLDGRVSNVKISEDKKGNIYFSMNITGSAISAFVNFSMAYGTNQCKATISPNFSSNRIVFSGNLYPENNSSIYKGRSF